MALNRGTWSVLHPAACVLIGVLGCLAIALLAPRGGADSRLAKARGPFLFRLAGQGVLVACVIVAQAVLLCATGVDASRATLHQACLLYTSHPRELSEGVVLGVRNHSRSSPR